MNEVLILMSTYNGEKYLREQIESLLHQTGVKVSILVRDDGSTDGTISILQDYKDKGILNYYIGDNLKPARSFMDLVYNAPDSPYYAFCDQDDVWLPGKLLVATEKMENIGEPTMYYHAMNLVDESMNIYGYYFRESEKAKSLQYSCLFGDEIAGCTMVFNKTLMNALRLYVPSYITMHDGWVHRVCLCIGGVVVADKTPYILYRQHGNNAVGINKRTISDKFHKFVKRERRFSKLAEEMLIGYGENLDENDKTFLELLKNYSPLKMFKILGVAKKLEKSNSINSKLFLKLLIGSF